MRKKLATVMTILTGASLVAAPATSAAGGTSIANAPQLTPGTKYFGTFPGSYRHNPTTEFWRVHLVAGDYFSLDGTTDREARYLNVKLFPAGTDDASLARKAPLDQASMNNVIRFAAPQTGTYPVEVTCERNRACGAVEFAVYIAVSGRSLHPLVGTAKVVWHVHGNRAYPRAPAGNGAGPDRQSLWPVEGQLRFGDPPCARQRRSRIWESENRVPAAGGPRRENRFVASNS